MHLSAASIAAASASPTASTLTMSSASASSGKLPLAASASTLDVACASISSVWLSSSTAKRAGTLASNGTRCSSRSQKAWMVSIFSPPGVSTARAKSVRASLTWARRRLRAFEFRQFLDEAVLVERHPAPEALEDADRHVGGGGLGEGEAQDAAGRRAGEQQAHDAVGEHLGLAGARIGRHPGRGARVGGAALRILGVVRDDEIRAHSDPSPPPALASDHSFTRAR